MQGNTRTTITPTLLLTSLLSLTVTHASQLGGAEAADGDMAFVSIKGGGFSMGSHKSEEERHENERQHQVQVEDYSMAMHEVTVAQFRRFVEATGYRTDADQDAGGYPGCFSINPEFNVGDWIAGRNWRDPGFVQGDDQPVVCVSWNDAAAYSAWLSQVTGKNYRLPTEAEWEYAARAGSTSARYWEKDSDACHYANVADETLPEKMKLWKDWFFNCKDGYGLTTAPVGSFQGNAFGLYDMLGNAFEMTCSTYYADYGGSEKQCASKNDVAVDRTIRGGSWLYFTNAARFAFRNGTDTTSRSFDTGFRLARIDSH